MDRCGGVCVWVGVGMCVWIGVGMCVCESECVDLCVCVSVWICLCVCLWMGGCGGEWGVCGVDVWVFVSLCSVFLAYVACYSVMSVVSVCVCVCMCIYLTELYFFM